MDWLGKYTDQYPFIMFSADHWAMILLLIAGAVFIAFYRNQLKIKNLRKAEVAVASSLFLMEAGYHLWASLHGIWRADLSLPVELCSFGLFLNILLLWTGKKIYYELLLFIALLGASQAILTPALDYGFSHFRFFHFFYIHIVMIWTVLYFTWVKDYRPTMRSVGKVIIFLNILLPLIFAINALTGGNYMFLMRKPESASLLDYLGPHPWYILSLEGLLIFLSMLVWLIFRKKDAG